jgi:hypothetical protein
MANEPGKALSAAVQRLLRPLIRILLRNGVSYRAFADLAKWVYVDVAHKEFPLPGRKQSVSRVSVITGLSRKEVTRLREMHGPDDALAGQEYNRAARVIAGWLRDQRFTDSDGHARALSFEGATNSFSDLVKAYSGDMPARAVLDELLRVEAVERRSDGLIHLRVRAYVPKGNEPGKLQILGSDVAHLIATIDHNLQEGDHDAYFQRKVAYDNLPEEAIPRLRELTGERGQKLLEELDRYLSQHDRDINPESQGTGRKSAGVGIFYFEDDFSGDD